MARLGPLAVSAYHEMRRMLDERGCRNDRTD